MVCWLTPRWAAGPSGRSPRRGFRSAPWPGGASTAGRSRRRGRRPRRRRRRRAAGSPRRRRTAGVGHGVEAAAGDLERRAARRTSTSAASACQPDPMPIAVGCRTVRPSAERAGARGAGEAIGGEALPAVAAKAGEGGVAAAFPGRHARRRRERAPSPRESLGGELGRADDVAGEDDDLRCRNGAGPGIVDGVRGRDMAGPWRPPGRQARDHMKPSSRRASSDIMSMPHCGSQTSSTSTVRTPGTPRPRRRPSPASRPRPGSRARSASSR